MSNIVPLKLKPKLPLTVPIELWEEMAAKTSVAFADSYLSGAELNNHVLTAKTNIAFHRLKQNSDAAGLLDKLEIRLARPPHTGNFAEPSRTEVFACRRCRMTTKGDHWPKCTDKLCP